MILVEIFSIGIRSEFFEGFVLEIIEIVLTSLLECTLTRLVLTYHSANLSSLDDFSSAGTKEIKTSIIEI